MNYVLADEVRVTGSEAAVETARALIRGTRMLERVETGLSMPQYRLLSLLAAADERSTALAQRLAVSKPAISNAVDTLTEAGHVRRLADPDDRRVVWLQITPTGADALAVADGHYADRLAGVLRRMDQPDTFLSAVASFADALDEDLAAHRCEHDLAHGRPVGRDALPLRSTPSPAESRA